MLVLSRKEGEDIVLKDKDGAETRFHIIEMDRNRVRIGIDAPRSTQILRGELLKNEVVAT